MALLVKCYWQLEAGPSGSVGKDSSHNEDLAPIVRPSTEIATRVLLSTNS